MREERAEGERRGICLFWVRRSGREDYEGRSKTRSYLLFYIPIFSMSHRVHLLFATVKKVNILVNRRPFFFLFNVNYFSAVLIGS